MNPCPKSNQWSAAEIGMIAACLFRPQSALLSPDLDLAAIALVRMKARSMLRRSGSLFRKETTAKQLRMAKAA